LERWKQVRVYVRVYKDCVFVYVVANMFSRPFRLIVGFPSNLLNMRGHLLHCLMPAFPSKLYALLFSITFFSPLVTCVLRQMVDCNLFAIHSLRSVCNFPVILLASRHIRRYLFCWW